MLHRANTDGNSKSFIRMKTAQVVEVHKPVRNSSNVDEIMIEGLKKRITNLEIDSSNLWNDRESLRDQMAQYESKSTTLEKIVKNLTTENLCLKTLLDQMKLEFASFKQQIESDINELKNTSAQAKKEERNLLRFGKNRPKRNEKNGFSSTLTIVTEEEEGLAIRKYMSHPDLTFPTDSPSSQSLSANGSFANSFVSEDGSEIDIDAEEARNIYYSNFPLPQSPSKVLSENEEPMEEFLARNAVRSRSSTFPASDQRFLGASLRKSTMKTANIFQPTKIFENFLVIGATKEKANLKLKENKRKCTDVQLDAEVLFNFAESVGMEEVVMLPEIENFLASKKLTMTEHSSSKAENLFFKIVLKSQRRYKKKFICPFQPHTNEIHISKWSDEAEAMNPQNKLYAICIKKGDFFCLNPKKKGDFKFVHTDTIYCLLTYYPFPQLLFNILVSILNIIRRRRKEVYWGAEKKDKKLIEFGSLDQIFLHDISQYLKDILNLPLPSPHDIQQYPVNDDKSTDFSYFKYKYPQKHNAYLELAIWEASKVLCRFSLENVKLILNAILLEKSIVFFSDNTTLLTATLNTFLALLFPLKFVSTIIPGLPSTLLRMCDAPVPILICINRKEDYFWNKSVGESSQCIFVFMDSKIIYIDEKSGNTPNFPKLEFITDELEGLYKKVNPRGSSFDLVTQSKVLLNKCNVRNGIAASKKRGSVMNNDVKEEKIQEDLPIIEKIFKHFRNIIEINVVSYLSHFSNYNPVHDGQDVKSKIDSLIQDENVRKFFYEFISTQAFCSYPYCVSLPKQES